ncbi:MAG: hypothetical protein FJ090_17205 [Deltaproteobacteria bacterium]|nr:hypothetical protein [Deltaproteobacteria bacterium]
MFSALLLLAAFAPSGIWMLTFPGRNGAPDRPGGRHALGHTQVTDTCPAQELDFTAERVEGNEVVACHEWKDNAASSSGGGVDTGF